MSARRGVSRLESSWQISTLQRLKIPDIFLTPARYTRLKLVSSFEELVAMPMVDGVNAICWARELPGNFAEVAEKLGPTEGITPIDKARLRSLSLSEAGRLACEVMLEDLERLRAIDLLPELNCIHRTVRDVRDGPFPTDVYSWHADSATVPADTWLCTYTGASSEGLRNEDAIRRADVPETRAALLELFGGGEGEDFHEFLNEHFYDLHYVAKPDAQPFSFGLHHLWRVATDFPENPVPPCIHRAPETLITDAPRLLLIS